MELYAAAGMEFVRELLEQKKQVFLDLKFYDIPARRLLSTHFLERRSVRKGASAS